MKDIGKLHGKQWMLAEAVTAFQHIDKRMKDAKAAVDALRDEHERAAAFVRWMTTVVNDQRLKEGRQPVAELLSCRDLHDAHRLMGLRTPPSTAEQFEAFHRLWEAKQ